MFEIKNKKTDEAKIQSSTIIIRATISFPSQQIFFYSFSPVLVIPVIDLIHNEKFIIKTVVIITLHFSILKILHLISSTKKDVTVYSTVEKNYLK